MAEYAKKTVAELTEILKSRGLPSSGKKAELIARLNEDDKNAEAQPAAVEEVATVAEPQTAPEPAAEPEPATTLQPVEPASTDATAAAGTATAEAETQAETTYTLNLKASDIDSELAKRKARAERFGTTVAPTAAGDSNANDTTTSEAEQHALKNLERAKRFGTDTGAISKLDAALPTERIRSNKRKATDEAPQTTNTSSGLDDPGLKKGFANRIGASGAGRGGRFRNRGGRPGAGNPRGPQGVTKPSNGVAPAYTSDKDRLAAEARKKKFATA